MTGVLVECDPSIKAILKKIDEDNNHEFIIEDLDDEHLLVKSDKHDHLKFMLKEVRRCNDIIIRSIWTNDLTQRLKDTVREPEDSGSD